MSNFQFQIQIQYSFNMTQSELPILKHLKNVQQNQARREGQKFSESILDELCQNNAQSKIDQNDVKIILKQPACSTQKVNIFEKQVNSETKINIFAKSGKSINLFNLAQNKSVVNIFEKAAKEPPLIVPSQDDDEKSEISEVSEIKKEENESFVKVMKYQYHNSLIKLKDWKVSKFRNGTSPSKENVIVYLEKHASQNNIIYFIVRNDSTKIIIYEALIIKNMSKTEKFMDKDQNIKLNVLKPSNKTQQKESKLGTKQIVKIQFENKEHAQEFKNQIKAIFENDL